MAVEVATPPEDYEYEGLAAGTSMAANMMAGALAGISEHAVMYPVDSIRTRMQVFTTSPAASYTGVSTHSPVYQQQKVFAHSGVAFRRLFWVLVLLMHSISEPTRLSRR
jgi:hypothetical protein